MNYDMTVPCKEGLINLRVGAIIMKNGKILMVGNDSTDYLYSVGGRINFGETSDRRSKAFCDRRESYIKSSLKEIV